jgi:CheY-like chemotaxis protein
MTDIRSWQVLVVEDEPDSMAVVTEILESNGITVHQAPNAEDAMAMMQSVTPTLAILDLALPMMDGWALLNEIRKAPPTANIPVVAVTAFHSANVAQQAIRSGFNAYFPKPIETTSFVRELERIVNEN